MRRYLWMLFALALPAVAYGQEVEAVVADEAIITLPGMTFLVALIAGLVLAIGFQLLLTNLSAAIGITSLRGLTSEKAHKEREGKEESHGPGVVKRTRTISHIFGVWTVITASIALFFASWLAVELSLTLNLLAGIVLALVIWGLFYLVLMTIEVSAVSSMVGSLVKMASTGLRTMYDATTSLFSRSDEQRIADAAQAVAVAVREELFTGPDALKMREQIQHYVSQLAPRRTTDIETIREDLKKTLTEGELQSLAESKEPLLDQKTLMALLEKRPSLRGRAKTLATSIYTAYQTIEEEARSDKDRVYKVTDAALRLSGMSSGEAQRARRDVEDYLRSTGKEELQPEIIKRDLENLLSHPRAGAEVLREKLALIDKPTLARVLSERRDMTEEEATEAVERIDKVLAVLRGITKSTKGKAQKGATTAEATLEVTKEVMAETKESILLKIQAYLDSLERPELSYDGIRGDLETLFHDPKAGADAMIHRLRAMDRDTFKAIVASRRDWTEEDAEAMLKRMEEARDRVIHKAEQMKVEVERRMEQVRQEALHQADEVRKTAASAAWWAFGTALISGAAAVAGGILAVLVNF